MNVVYLLLGSNLNDREALLTEARNEIAATIGTIAAESSIYESEPWGFRSNNRFLNQVLTLNTRLSPAELLQNILGIETRLGRIRNGSGKYSSRIIDIDILFYNNEIVLMDNLVIPHPRIPERMFTLLPLMELNHAMIHPGSNKSIREMITECLDQSVVLTYQPVQQP